MRDLRRVRAACFLAYVGLSSSFHVVDYSSFTGWLLTALLTVLLLPLLGMTWVLNDRARGQHARKPRPVWVLRLLALVQLDPSYLDARAPGAAERYRASLPRPLPPQMPTVYLDAEGKGISPPP